MLPIEKLYMDNTYQNPPFFCSEPRKLPRLSTVCCNSTAAVRSWWACVVIDRVVQQELLYLPGSKIWQIGKSSAEKSWETCEKKMWKFVEIRKIFLEPGKFGELYGNVLDFSGGNLGIQVILIFYG